MRVKKEATGIKNFIKNIPLAISGIALAVLCLSSKSSVLICAIVLAIVFAVAALFNNAYAYWKSNMSPCIAIVSVLLLGVCFLSFYGVITSSSKIQALLSVMGLAAINIKIFAVGCSLIGVIAGFYCLSLFVEIVYSKADLAEGSQCSAYISAGNMKMAPKQYLFVFAVAIVTITICSKSSPIYPFNDWVDSNCFMTVGKSMLHGLVPYRDLFEQKGPLLYMLHALAALISETSFIGVYFLEIISCTVFLIFSWKIIKLYELRSTINTLMIPILAAVVYSAACFCHGDSAEELCLPMFAFAVYIALKSIRLHKYPTGFEFFAIGITAACVLWIKFSMLGFYGGWFCALAIYAIKERKTKALFCMIVWIAVGVFVLTAPILIYFALNQALADLWTVYFYDNLFLYSSTSNHFILISIAYNLLAGIKNILTYNQISALAIGIAFFALSKSKKMECFAFASMVAFTALLVYAGGRRYTYYSLIFSAFAPVGMAVFSQLIQNISVQISVFNKLKWWRKGRSVIVCAVSFVFAFALSGNTYLLKYSKSDMPQYQFAEIIAQKENATLLNYGFLDGGFYTVAGIVPSCRYFCNLNIGLPEIMDTQNEFAEQGKVDFIVTRDTDLEFDLYKCVASASFYFEGAEREYLLYQLIE